MPDPAAAPRLALEERLVEPPVLVVAERIAFAEERPLETEPVAAAPLGVADAEVLATDPPAAPEEAEEEEAVEEEEEEPEEEDDPPPPLLLPDPPDPPLELPPPPPPPPPRPVGAPPPPLEKLRLPRSCGPRMVTNFSGPVVPLMRIESTTLPARTVVVRMTAAARFCASVSSARLRWNSQ